MPATNDATFDPALAPLSVGTDKCSSASPWRSAAWASLIAGTSPLADTRFGSSNLTDMAWGV